MKDTLRGASQTLSLYWLPQKKKHSMSVSAAVSTSIKHVHKQLNNKKGRAINVAELALNASTYCPPYIFIIYIS